MNTLAAEISVPERQVSKWIKICFTSGGTRSSPPKSLISVFLSHRERLGYSKGHYKTNPPEKARFRIVAQLLHNLTN